MIYEMNNPSNINMHAHTFVLEENVNVLLSFNDIRIGL
jgi:hypothetical protein